MLRKVFDSKLKMENNMGDLIELMSIIGSLESRYRRDIGKGFKARNQNTHQIVHGNPTEEIIERMYYWMNW